MEGDNHPLALNAYVSTGPNSYIAAINAVHAAVDPEKDPFYTQNPDMAKFIVGALSARIFSQSGANYMQYEKIYHAVGDDEDDYVEGNKSPAELTGYLMWHDELESIEIGRRTLPRIWNTKPLVDGPIRSDLDDAKGLGTMRRKSPVVYRIKDLDLYGNPDDVFIQVDRKRVVRQHFGGRILTFVRNSIVLHNTDTKSPLPKSVYNIITKERRQAKDSPDYSYDTHQDELSAILEPYVRTRNDSEKPNWMVPILTTYYSVKKEAIKDERLKEIA